MKLYQKITLLLFYLFSIIFTAYTYVLLDPSLTLINVSWWHRVRDFLVNFGYYQRYESSFIYLTLILIFFVFHYIFTKDFKKYRLIYILVPIFTITVFSYFFLSRDLINYMFDARIVTHYHQNPYLKRAIDFSDDNWLRLMHGIDRKYLYGPVFLPITLVPSFLGLGKFLPTMLLFKSVYFAFFLLAVYFLKKINRKSAFIFATHPLIIIEGLVNAHNDMIALALGVVGIYFILQKKIIGRLFALLSAGIKYTTFQFLIISKDKKLLNHLSFFITIALAIFLSYRVEIQPWYYLPILAFLPFYEKAILSMNVLFAGLLFSYYPYVRFGEWTIENVYMKHQIIYLSIFFGVAYFFYFSFKKSKK